MALTVFTASYLLSLSLVSDATSCIKQSCHGDVGNLAVGRDITVSSTCGSDEDSPSLKYCHFEDGDCALPVCSPCLTGVNGLSHPGSYLLDSPFTERKTYWQSKPILTDDERVTAQFDLETAFYFTHLIMVFKTPRPGAMILERSVDFGKSWQVYQYYARNCKDTFGMSNEDEDPNSNCTTAYSTVEPCSNGEVIYRVLNPIGPANDPYSAESRHLMKVTNIRVQMWMPQICSKCQVTEEDIPSFRHFAVYDMIIRGTCFCNGHADSCVPLDNTDFEPRETGRAVVHGKCICEHNTAGDHCEKCMPLYNDAPWRSGNGYTGKPNPCKRCNCNGHAESCHFDSRIWSLTGQTTGGVCDNCKHNTAGRTCDSCKDHYFRRPDSLLTDPDACQECNCHSVGTVSMNSDDVIADVDITDRRVPLPCNTISGQCECKHGVAGKRCDRCQQGFWGLGDRGCKKCVCPSGLCDQVSGECLPDYGDDDAFFTPMLYRPSDAGYVPRYPEFPSYSSFQQPQFKQGERMAASRRRLGSCYCKEKDLESIPAFCKMKYDYAVKVRVLGAEDDGTTTIVSVAVKRVIKQSKVKIRKGKMFMYPESWTVMGCTCPALIPRSDYIVVGHEDPDTNRLMVNTDSFVKRWSHTKNWARVMIRVLRTKCV